MTEGKKSICIMFPNNSTSVMIGQFLVSELQNVGFFITEGTHEQAAFTCYEEVKLASAGLDCTVSKLKEYSDISKFDFVIFPCLDVKPRNSRKEFAGMCRNLFK